MEKEYLDDKEKESFYKEVNGFIDEVKTATALKKEEVDEIINLVKGVYEKKKDTS